MRGNVSQDFDEPRDRNSGVGCRRDVKDIRFHRRFTVSAEKASASNGSWSSRLGSSLTPPPE